MAKKKKSTEKKARVHKDLEGFEIKVNPLGEITSNYNIDQINKFLDKNVHDKKLTKKEEEAEEEEEVFVEEDGDDGEDGAEAEEDDEHFLKNSGETGGEDEELPPKPRGRK